LGFFIGRVLETANSSPKKNVHKNLKKLNKKATNNIIEEKENSPDNNFSSVE
jgi:hypothetical protein